MRLLVNTVIATATLLLGVAVLASAAAGDAHWVRLWAVLIALIGVVSAVQLLHENRVNS